MRDHHADNARFHAKLVSDAINWQSTTAHWDVSPRLIAGIENRVIDSPPIPVFGLPYQFFARLHLDGEKVEIELRLQEAQQPNGVERPTVLLRDISISIDAGYTLCFAKRLQDGEIKAVGPDTDSVGISAFFYKRRGNEVNSSHDGEEIQRVRTTVVEVTRAMIQEESDDAQFTITFDVKKNVEHFLASR